MAPRDKTPMIGRTIRVPAALWDAAMAKAAERGESLSQEIRKFLTSYIKR